MNDLILHQFIAVPVLICFARICDVTMGTLRLMYVAKGMKGLATILAFIEVSIWLFALGQVLQNLTNYMNCIAYITGYTVGTYVGICIEEKLSFGTMMLRIITKRDADELIAFFKSAGYGLTRVKAEGAYGSVDVIFTIVRRNNVNKIIEIIKKFNPNAFYTVEEVKFVNDTPFPLPSTQKKVFPFYFNFLRKAKI